MRGPLLTQTLSKTNFSSVNGTEKLHSCNIKQTDKKVLNQEKKKLCSILYYEHSQIKISKSTLHQETKDI